MPDAVDECFMRKSANILLMIAVGGVGDGHDLAPVVQMQAMARFEIDRCDLFAFAQIGKRGHGLFVRHAKSDAPAAPAPIKPENKTRAIRRAPVMDGRDAQGPVIAMQGRADFLRVVKAWPPHQRSIAENPEIAIVGVHDGSSVEAVPVRRGIGSVLSL